MNSVGDINFLQNITVAILFYFVGITFVFFLKNQDRATIAKIFSIAFVLRVASIYLLYFYLISIGGDGFAYQDDRKYDYVAKDISIALSEGRDGYKEYGGGWANIGYFNLNGWLYHNFDFDTLSARLVNALLSALVAVLFYLIFESMLDRKRAVVIGYTMALFPNLIYWASFQFKDTAIIFCSSVLMYVLICKFRYKLSIISFLVFCIFTVFLWLLRKNYCFPYLAVVVLLLLFRYTRLDAIINSKKRSVFPKLAILGVFGIGITAGMLFSSAGSDFVGSIEKFSGGQSALASSGYGFTRHLRVVSPVDVYKLPAAMAFTALAPLPTFVGITNPVRAGSRIHSLANLGLVAGLPFVIAGFFLFKGDKILFTDSLLLKWIPLMMLCVLSIVYMGNLRYKATLLVYFACWASLAIYERKKIRGKLLAIYGISFLAIILILPIAVIFR